MNKVPAFLFLVELSEKRQPFRSEHHHGFEFCYEANINEDLITLTRNGVSSVMYLEEETLKAISCFETLEEHKQTMMEIIEDHMRLGSLVIFTTMHIIEDLADMLERSLYKNRFCTIRFKPGSVPDVPVYHIGIPYHCTDTGDYHDKHFRRVAFLPQEQYQKISA